MMAARAFSTLGKLWSNTSQIRSFVCYRFDKRIGKTREATTGHSCYRSVATFQTSRGQNKKYDENDSDSEFETDHKLSEQDLDQLRKLHRTSAKKDHLTNDSQSFTDFNLNPQLESRLTELGYDKPFEIQVKTLEHTLQGKDVIGRAVTGSGKTLAFSIPIVQKLSTSRPTSRISGSPRAIVISPTRELCLQIHRSIEELDPSLRCVAVYGGDSIHRQQSVIRRGIDVVCATPGRLNDHIKRGAIKLDCVQFLCLDEADELLTPNFKDQIEDVLQNSPQDKQMMMFSATMPSDIKQLTKMYMKDAVYVDITKNRRTKGPESVQHQCIRIPEIQYLPTVTSLITEHQPQRCIVFLKTKVKADRAASQLSKNGHRASALHSDISQTGRERILNKFRQGYIKILTATDVAARGLDIPEVDLVIQAGPPVNGVDYYLHRSGRTGRAGRQGLAVMLYSKQDTHIIKQIERMVDMSHTKPPNLKELEKTTVENIVQSLYNVSDYDKSKTIDVARTLDLEGDKGHQLMAAALALVMKDGGGGDEMYERKQSHLSNSRDHQHGHHDRWSGGKSPRKPRRQRTDPDWWDEEID